MTYSFHVTILGVKLGIKEDYENTTRGFQRFAIVHRYRRSQEAMEREHLFFVSPSHYLQPATQTAGVTELPGSSLSISKSKVRL